MNAIATLSDDDLLAVENAASIQAVYEAQAPLLAPDEVQAVDEAVAQAPAHDVDQAGEFADLVAAVPEATGQMVRSQMVAGLHERARFEKDKNGFNEKIQKTISKTIAMFDNLEVGKQMFVSGANPNLWNHAEVEGSRRNVYSFEKIRDILAGANRGHLKNIINVSILASMVRCMDRGLPFTMTIAKGCASDKNPIPVEYMPICRRHTVAASTGDTQASSTMTALEALGVVTNVGTYRHQVFQFTNSPLARAVIEMVRVKHMPITH